MEKQPGRIGEGGACSQRLQFIGESVESLRNSTDRGGLRPVVRDYSLWGNP
jgi:hypothetical protein